MTPPNLRRFIPTPADQEIVEASEAFNVAMLLGRQPGIITTRAAWQRALEKRQAHLRAGEMPA